MKNDFASTLLRLENARRIKELKPIVNQIFDDCERKLCSNMREKAKSMKVYAYHINLDERGEFFADVRDGNDTVFEIHGFDIFEDGFMKHKRDLAGLAEYLKQLNIIPANAAIVSGQHAIQDLGSYR